MPPGQVRERWRMDQGRRAGREPLHTSLPKPPVSSPMLCSDRSLKSSCWETLSPECSLVLGCAQTPPCTPDLAERLAYSHTQNELGNFSQGQMEMAFGLPTIWLDYLHHCLRPLLRTARRGLDCPWCSRMTLWRADYSLCAEQEDTYCHFFASLWFSEA